MQEASCARGVRRDHGECAAIRPVLVLDGWQSVERTRSTCIDHHLALGGSMTGRLKDRQNSEAQSMSVENRTAASFERSSPLIVQTQTSIVGSHPVELTP